MFVVKRNGQKERVHFDKITSRISKLAYGLNMNFVDPGAFATRPPTAHAHPCRLAAALLCRLSPFTTLRCCGACNDPSHRPRHTSSACFGAAMARGRFQPFPASFAPSRAVLISQKCVKGVYTGVKTTDLDALAAETAAYLTTEHPDYSILAARIAVSNLHKQTLKVSLPSQRGDATNLSPWTRLSGFSLAPQDPC